MYAYLDQMPEIASAMLVMNAVWMPVRRRFLSSSMAYNPNIPGINSATYHLHRIAAAARTPKIAPF